MAKQIETVNRYTVVFQLNEALEAIDLTLREIEYGTDADPAMWVFLGEILDHLCLAWNQRQMGPHEIAVESQEDYELKTVSVPNWGGHFRLVELSAAHSGVDARATRQEIRRETVRTHLHAAKADVQALVAKLESGHFDSYDIRLLGNEFAQVVRNLCLAWHLRYLDRVEISSLDPTALEELEIWLPLWRWNYRLMPLERDPGTPDVE